MDAERQVSRCHLGSQTALINKLLFGLEIVSKPKYEPLKNIRALSKGTTPLCTPLLHFAWPDSFHGWGKCSIFLCSAFKIIKGGINPHPVILHTHSLHFPHLPWSSPPNLHALQKKKIFFWEICAYSKSSAAAFLRNIPRYWQQVSTGVRHRVVPQSAAADRHHSLSSKP